MKKIYLLAILLAPSFVSAQIPDGLVTIYTEALKERGDSLHINITIGINGNAVNNRQSLVISPELFTADSIRNLPEVLINGRQQERQYNRRVRFNSDKLYPTAPHIKTSIQTERDTLIKYTLSIPYRLWMDSATLRINNYLSSPAGKIQLISVYGSTGVTLEPREPYTVQPKTNLIVPEREEKQRRMQGQAYLDFQTGQSVIIPSFRRNPEELAKIAEAVTKVQNDPDVEITGLYVEGYASPDGSYAINERLSRERSQALRDYMVTTFGLSAELFRVSSVAEDWDGLRSLMEQSDLPQKEKIYSIIDSEDDYDRKEARLRSLGGPWRTMLSEIFPQLRRVEYQIDFSVKDYTVEESRAIAGKNPEILSQRELFILAQSYPRGSSERDEVFDLMFRQYPDEVTATVNSAAAMLERGEDATAKRYLDRVAGDPRAQNNLGVYFLKAGDLDRAEELFESAVAAGVEEASHNLEEVRRKREDNEIMKRYEK